MLDASKDAPVINAMPKGTFAIAHIQKSGCSMLAGHYTYSRYFIVKVTKADREGRVREFIDWEGATAPRKNDRFTVIYAAPKGCGQSVMAKVFASQALDFTGYSEKTELRAAINKFSPITI